MENEYDRCVGRTAASLATVAALAFGCGRLRFDANAGGDVGDGDDSGVADDALGDGGGPLACNLMSGFADDFADGVFDQSKWGASYANGGTTYGEAGGDLVITLVSAPNQNYAGYKSLFGYDLRGGRVMTEVVALPSGPESNSGLTVEYEVDTLVNIGVQNNLLHARQIIGGTFTSLATVPYDPVNHRYWAFAESNGLLNFEASADGINFTPFHSITPPFDLSLVQVHLMAGTDSMATAPGVARFASLNTGVASASPACGVSSFSDTFDDGVIGHDWNTVVVAPCCSQQETGGVLRFSSDGSLGYVGIRSARSMSLRDSAIIVRMPKAPLASTRLIGALIARLDSMNSLELQVSQGNVTGRTVVAGTSTNGTPLALPAQDVYLRLSEATGMTSFEVSTDRVGWQLVRQVPTPFSVDDVGIILQAGVANMTTGADTVEFDDLGP